METRYCLLFFRNQTYNLFGVLHEPDESTTAAHPAPCPLGIVFCHPFAEEKLISHRTMVNLARHLAKDGICCFRFDYMGHGDSDGNFEDASVETRISDIGRAVNFLKLRTKIEHVGLLGIRFGATLATMVDANENGLKFLILISPILNGKIYMEQCLRSNLATQIATNRKITRNRNQLINDLTNNKMVNIDGYLLTKTLYQQISTINLLNSPVNPSKNILIIQISKKEMQLNNTDINQLIENLNAKNFTVKSVHLNEDYFWIDNKSYKTSAENVYNAVTNWISNVKI